MNHENKTEAKFDEIQTAAIVSSSVFVLWFAIYWFFQISAERELLEFVRVNNF